MRFVAEADLTDYDLSGMRLVRFEFQPKSERVNMRLPKALLDAVKTAAAKAGMPYQRFIRPGISQAMAIWPPLPRTRETLKEDLEWVRNLRTRSAR